MDHMVVIGAGSGIGANVARRVAGAGRTLLLHTGHNRAGLESVAAACRDAGSIVHLCVGDLCEEQTFRDCEEWLRQVPVGAISGFVFAAGYARLGTVASAAPEDLAAAFTSMPGAFHRLIRSCAPKLAHGRARVVCISAFGAHRQRNLRFFATASAKAALEAQVRLVAAEFADRGITCNNVVPGFIAKEAGRGSSLSAAQWQAVVNDIPMRRLGQADDVAAAIQFLLSADAGYITGQTLHIDGGLML